MEEKEYVLNCSVFYYDDRGMSVLLKENEITSHSLNDLNKRLDQFSGIESEHEQLNIKSCIKYSALLYESAREIIPIKEKYLTLRLEDFNPDFWQLTKKYA